MLNDRYSLTSRNSFATNLSYLTCRRIIEENHGFSIISLLEEKCHDGICRYVAAISKQQVNMYYSSHSLISYRYDNEDNNSSLGFFAHYVVQKTPYFKGGVAFKSISHP